MFACVDEVALSPSAINNIGMLDSAGFSRCTYGNDENYLSEFYSQETALKCGTIR